MSLTLGVSNLPKHSAEYQHWRGPVFLTGLMSLDAKGAELHDWDGDVSVALRDPEACAAMMAAISPATEYLGGALLQVWVRESAAGPELHGSTGCNSSMRTILGESNAGAKTFTFGP